MGIKHEKSKVFLVDFGLAKVHIDPQTKRPEPPRKNTDFRGTVSYASINAHLKEDLARRDDMWSYFFIIMEFLDEALPWKNCKLIRLFNFYSKWQR